VRVVENNADRVPMSRPYAAYAMPEIHAIHTAGALHRAVMNRKHDPVPLTERRNNRPRLHARTLLRHHEFAAGKISVRLREQHRELKRESMLPVQILVQAVVIIGPIL
jgi:hypothetical protein